jgi:N-acetylglucosaminylphosphatidylinositol deacetylase
MTTDWDPEAISNLLSKHTTTTSGSALGLKPTLTTDILITFDKHGVSNHTNHRSLYLGARSFIQDLAIKHEPNEPPISLYTLFSVGRIEKYASIFDAPLTVLGYLIDSDERILSISSVKQWRQAQTAMTSAHVSQMRWFRWGWVTLSRYMVVNELRKENVGVQDT